MQIKIIKGNYGYNNGVSVRVKTPTDVPFSVDDKEAERLISEGIAVKVSEDGNAPDILNETGGTAEQSENINSDTPSDNGAPSYDESMQKATLQAIAKEYGLEISEKASKAEIVTALDEYFSDMPDFSEV